MTATTRMLLALTICFFFGILTSLSAATLAGVSMPDQVSIENRTYTLNGLGIREVTIFKVDVYIAGLYLERKMTAAKNILRSDAPKYLKLHFVHKTSKSRFRAAWEKGFKKNIGTNYFLYEDQIKKLLSTMKEMGPGETLSFLFTDRGVDIWINDRKKQMIAGRDFAKAMLSLWLGPYPPNEDLKLGLLGLGKEND